MKRKISKLSFILAVAFLMVFSACKKDDTPAEPDAKFSMINYIKAPVDVTFTNSSTDATSYLWSFSDSITSTEKSPTQTFSTKGSYKIVLTAKNDDGKTSSTTKYLKVYGNITSWSPGRIELMSEAWAEEEQGITIYMSVWDANNSLYDYNGEGTFNTYSNLTENTSSLIFVVSNPMTLAMNAGSKVTIKFQLYDGGEHVNPTIDPIVYQIVLNGSDVLPTEAEGPYKQSFSADNKINIDLNWAD